jgi:hypothetical protein
MQIEREKNGIREEKQHTKYRNTKQQNIKNTQDKKINVNEYLKT